MLGAWWLAVSALVAITAHAQKEPLLHCWHPSCQYLGQKNTSNFYWQDYYYNIEGNTIQFRYRDGQPYPTLTLNCEGASILCSRLLPRAQSALLVQSVVLESCPVPAVGSLSHTFAKLNLMFCKQDAVNETCELEFNELPAAPTLAAKHFHGLERLNTLTINANTLVTPERGFLAPLGCLRSLRMNKVQPPPGVLDELPSLLETLSISQSCMPRVPDGVYSLAKLQELTVVDDNPFDARSVPQSVRQLVLVSPATTLELNVTHELRIFELRNWLEPLPTPIARCEPLLEIYLTAPVMRALPKDWLANCARLEILRIFEAYNLNTLPPTLFSPRTPIMRLTLSEGSLAAVPEMILHDVRHLTTIELNNNRLQTLSSKTFAYLYSLSKLDLSSNDLDSSVMDALSQRPYARPTLMWLTDLKLSHNPRIGDLCVDDGKSQIHGINLRTLELSDTGVSRICNDWREEMLELKLLDLTNTNVSTLSYEDLQFKRTVQAKVILRGAPVTTVRLTREDYNAAVGAPPSFTSVEMDAEVECDCTTYWVRRALEHPPAKLSLPRIRDLSCVGGGLLRDVPLEDMVCSAREECDAAELSPECECDARPDDDTTQSLWRVRARCDNSSLGFVQRRIYPFYPLRTSINQGAYITNKVSLLNVLS